MSWKRFLILKYESNKIMKKCVVRKSRNKSHERMCILKTSISSVTSWEPTSGIITCYDLLIFSFSHKKKGEKKLFVSPFMFRLSASRWLLNSLQAETIVTDQKHACFCWEGLNSRRMNDLFKKLLARGGPESFGRMFTA